LSGESAREWKALIASLQATWKKFAGDAPFQYEFVDQAFAQSFRDQDIFSKALGFLAALTILIASLGLLGMIVFTLELKTKEIGIRKVIGATAWNILLLVSKEYTRLIGISIFLSIPISLWLMNHWLKEFEYKIKLSPATFIAAGIITLCIAMMITGYHAVKAALMNPVDVLKNE
jgi:putative ABC transport system permease protein